jgi:hypothetical protein
MQGRSFRVERTGDITWPRATTTSDCCRATIRLDGKTYRCERVHVDGIHDAFSVHSDSGLVRW